MYVWFVSTQRLAGDGPSHFEQSALKLIVDRLVFEHQSDQALEPHHRIIVCFISQTSSVDDFTVTLSAQAKAREALGVAGLNQAYHVKLCLAGAGDQALARAINDRAQLIEPKVSKRFYPHHFVDDWVIVPPGEIVGENGETWRQERPFSMSQTLVTQSLYQGVMGDTSPIRNGPLFPATGTSWLDAVLFCNKLSELLELEPYYEVNIRASQVVVPDASGLGIRLPTRVEWCYAACGDRSWPYSGSDLAEEVAWSAHNSGSKVHPVARLKHNNFGLYDMSGNLWEWCHEGPQDAEREMTCIGDHHPKWLLGGSWANHPWVFPIGENLTELPGYRDEFMGFRVVRHLAPNEIGSFDVTRTDPNPPLSDDVSESDQSQDTSHVTLKAAQGAVQDWYDQDQTSHHLASLTSAERFSWWVVTHDQKTEISDHTSDMVPPEINTPQEQVDLPIEDQNNDTTTAPHDVSSEVTAKDDQ
jgi:formylglycine-generating enzyme required for sulfatase activity